MLKYLIKAMNSMKVINNYNITSSLLMTMNISFTNPTSIQPPRFPQTLTRPQLPTYLPKTYTTSLTLSPKTSLSRSPRHIPMDTRGVLINAPRSGHRHSEWALAAFFFLSLSLGHAAAAQGLPFRSPRGRKGTMRSRGRRLQGARSPLARPITRRAGAYGRERDDARVCVIASFSVWDDERDGVASERVLGG